MAIRILTSLDIAEIVNAVGAETLIDQLIDDFTDGLLANRKARRRPNSVRRVGDTICMLEDATGRMTFLMDAKLPTALCTGAASALASRILAAPGSDVVGIAGCSPQAMAQLRALTRVFRVERVLIYDPDRAAARSFADRCETLVPDIDPVPLSMVEAEANILCATATGRSGGALPIVGGRLKQSVHINAMARETGGAQGLPRSILERSLVCPDASISVNTGSSLAELVKNARRYMAYQNSPTVFDCSSGCALLNEIVTRVIFEHAVDMDLGRLIALDVETFDECHLLGARLGPRNKSAQS